MPGVANTGTDVIAGAATPDGLDATAYNAIWRRDQERGAKPCELASLFSMWGKQASGTVEQVSLVQPAFRSQGCAMLQFLTNSAERPLSLGVLRYPTMRSLLTSL